jgi:hypothetical protein
VTHCFRTEAVMAGMLQCILVLIIPLVAASSARAARPINAQPMRYLLQAVDDPYTTGVPMVEDEVGCASSSKQLNSSSS